MENEGKTHDVRLFISHDAPLQGSNTPIGVQYFSRHFYNEYVQAPILSIAGEVLIPFGFSLAELMSNAINVITGWNTMVDAYVSPGDVLTLQDAPAALQMNYEWVTFDENVTTYFHDQWQEEFESVGYPKNSRNIAISNGNMCGKGHGFTPGERYINVDDYDNPDFWGDLVHMIATPFIGIVTGDVELVLLGLLPGSSKYHYVFQINSATNNKNEVYYGRVYYEKSIWTPFGDWVITHKITGCDKHAKSFSKPYGYYAGGVYDIQNVIDELPGFFPPLEIINARYGFIPVVSALDIEKSGSSGLNAYDYKKTYAKNSLPPNLSTEFDNFFVHYNGFFVNSDHISFNSRIGNWLAQELSIDPTAPNPDYPIYDCSILCSTKINGPDVLCAGISVFSVPAGASSYTWTVTQPGVIESGQGTHEITLSAGIGTVNLKVTVGSENCGSRVLTKTMPTGYISFNRLEPIGDQSGYSPMERDISPVLGGIACNQISLQAIFDSPAPILEYKWKKVTTDVSWNLSQGPTATSTGGHFILFPSCNKEFTFQVKARTACMWTPWKTISYQMQRCTKDCPPDNGGSTGGPNFILSPNPVAQNGQLNVEVKSGAPYFTHPAPVCSNCPDLTPGQDEPQEVTNYNPTVNIEIFDLSGNPVLSFQNRTLPTTLNLNSLSTGTYIVNILNNNGTAVIESNSIIIQ